MPTVEPYTQRPERVYALTVLTAGCALNFLDRQLLAILQEPIKQELGLTDTQLGLLSGLSFAAVYVVFGVVFAQWSESRPRRGVIALAIGAWSLMTAFCGLAQGFAQLLLARMGVAIGEAGSGPASHSMIADIFPPQSRGMALATYAVGINLGILGGYLLGGWINEFYGWRAAFLLLGLPGVLFALVVRFTVAEPQRGRFDTAEARARNTPRLGEALAELWAKKSFRWLALAASFNAFGLYGIGAWFPSYLIRTFGLGTGEAGTWLALVVGGIGGLGTLAGGWFGDRLGQRDPRWYLWLPLICAMVGLPFALAMLQAREPGSAMLLNAVPVFAYFVYMAPVLVVSQLLVGPRMRAMTSAVLFFVINLVGMGGGPVFVGLLSDALVPHHGAEALRMALIVTVLISTALSTLTFLAASLGLRADLPGSSRLSGPPGRA